MRGLNADSLFTNIPLEETIDIWISTFFEINKRVEVWSKIESKELLSIAKYLFASKYLLNVKLCKQVDGVAMGAYLGFILTNGFLVYFERNCSHNCPLEFKPYYQQHFDGIFVSFTIPECRTLGS